MGWTNNFDYANFDSKDPNPWQSLFLDKSLPIDQGAKQALLDNNNAWSRRVLLPLLRPLAKLLIILVQLIRLVLPAKVSSSFLLHRGIAFGLKYFVKPEASYLILRHFIIGSQILRFIEANVNQFEFTRGFTIKAASLDDLKDDMFLKHDLNLFNFVTSLNGQVSDLSSSIRASSQLDFSSITDDIESQISVPKKRWFRFLDLQSAIELYTPIYGLFLSDHDFWRAVVSLQLDETIAGYVARILNDPFPLIMVNNRHPMVPHSTLNAGFRLMLHGLDAEQLHGYLLNQKKDRSQ
ncbi:DUF6999 family protein [Pleionea litopenaei]|uniref:Uncharacterized protein n=1 Tax=Pleionea litopenaei TaxID=3070815 RepID=A0AA51X6J7_9GAMM|nr:hypothetical protein [Pleionea sp. HL-JVS1]WMS87367.1 hypothetical protein Q9312_00205 [Pleionea sp. HL-JVS1]